MTRISTGIAGLDDILCGGWPANHLYLVEGDPGTGKTTLALQFLLEGVKQGERVLYITLSESRAELLEIAASHEWPLEGVQIFEYAPEEESLRPENEYSALHPSEVEFQDTMQSILKAVDESRPSRVVFDSLSEIRLLARDSLRYRRQVLALKHFFLNRSCTVLMLDDRTSDAHDLQLQSIAHGVLFLDRIPRDYGTDRRRVRVSKLRGSRFREGFHDYSISPGGLRIFPRLVASEHRSPTETGTGKSGVAKLDALWDGGIPRGTNTLVTGPGGVGKSTLVTRYAFAAAERGETAAIFQFDETEGTFLTRSAGLGMNLQPFLDSGKMILQQVDPAELSPGEFVSCVRDAVENKGARVLVIDSLNGFMIAMTGEKQMLLQMHELCTFLNQRGVLTFLVLSQSGMLGDEMSPPIELTYLADNVLLLRYFEEDGEVRKAVSLVKKRNGQHETTIRELRLRNGEFAIGEPLKNFRGVLRGVPTYTGSSSALEGAMGESLKD